MNILISSMDVGLVNLIEQSGKQEVFGTVVNIFDKVINVETTHPISLMTVATSAVISAPYMMKINDNEAFNYLKSKVKIGDVFFCDKNGQLRVNTDQLMYNSSEKWHCLIPPMEITASKINDRLKEVNTFLINEGKSGGILNAYLSRIKDIEGRLACRSIYDNYFKELIQHLTDAFDGDNLKKFVGLGIGLTPSGDDFIVGVLAALYSYDVKSKYIDKILSQISKESIDGKTTRVSKHMLDFALDGQFNQGLLNVLDETKHVQHSLEQLKSIGSTSGTDMLVGVSFALNKLLED